MTHGRSARITVGLPRRATTFASGGGGIGNNPPACALGRVAARRGRFAYCRRERLPWRR
jgi:hypothetical protein